MKSLTRYIIFHKNHVLAPRLVKTKATVNKALRQDQKEMEFKTYDNQIEAESALQKMMILHKKKVKEMKNRKGQPEEASTEIIVQKTEEERYEDKKKMQNIKEWKQKWKSWKLSGQELQRKVKNQRNLMRQTGKIPEEQLKQRGEQIKKTNRFIDISRLIDTSKELYEGFVPSPMSQKKVDSIELFFDGCSKGNPGESGIGYVAKTNKGILFQNSLYVGQHTNNQAQWIAFMWGLTDCVLKEIPRVQVYGDSNLVIQSMRKTWKLAKPQLIRYEARCRQLEQHFAWIGFNHIGRQNNKLADELANMSIKTHQKLMK